MIVLAGILTPIEEALTAVLEWLHRFGFSWAWAIVVLTVAVRILLVPLAVQQIRSMQRLQIYAPQLKALQEKYKHDKQRRNEEVMRFYRENKVNPAASCLPMLPQIPIFIALFYVLRDFEKEVFPRYPGSELDFISVVPDITADITGHWSGWLLLALYVGSQVASTFFMSTTMDRSQRIIFLLLPLVFVYFIVNPPIGNLVFPVGLLLYWVTTNLWTVGQGLIIRRLIPRPPPPPKRTSRSAPSAPSGPSDDGATTPDRPARPAPAQPRVRRRKKKGPRARR